VEKKGAVRSFSFLGCDIHYDTAQKEVNLCNRKLEEKLLSKYFVGDTRTAPTPIANHNMNSGNSVSKEQFDYRGFVGLCTYLSTTTRPDISFATKELAKAAADPREESVNSARRLAQYLRGEPCKGVTLRGSPINSAEELAKSIEMQTDADWAGAKMPGKEWMRSTTGVSINVMGSTLFWRSTTQRSVSMSTMEAELQALSKGVQDLLVITRVISSVWGVELSKVRGAELSVQIAHPIRCLCDNQSTIYISTPGSTTSVSKNRHVCVRAAFVREQVSKRNISLHYVKSEDNLADRFTKPLPAPQFQKLLGKF
jgi:hypothetical protein